MTDELEKLTDAFIRQSIKSAKERASKSSEVPAKERADLVDHEVTRFDLFEKRKTKPRVMLALTALIIASGVGGASYAWQSSKKSVFANVPSANSQAGPHSSAESVPVVSPPAATPRSLPPSVTEASSDTPQPSGTPLAPPTAKPATQPAPSPLVSQQSQAADTTPAASKTQADEQIAALLGRIETLLDEGHIASPAGDNASEVFGHALALSSSASPTGLRTMAEFPSALKRRANAEREAGHSDLSLRLEVFADVVSSVVGFHDTPPRGDAAPSTQSGDANVTAGSANPAARKAAAADQTVPPVSGETSSGGDVATSPSKASTDTSSPLPAPPIPSQRVAQTAGTADPAAHKASAADQATRPVIGEPSKESTDTRSPLPTPPRLSQPVPQYVSPPPATETTPPAPSGTPPTEEQVAMIMVPLAPPTAAPLAPSPPVNPAAARPSPSPQMIQQPQMVFLAGGRFQMGSREDPSEEPAHFVQVRPFWIAKYPVTVDEWRACVAAGGCKDIQAAVHEPDRPMSNVSWLDAMSYVTWLARTSGQSYRLPSEAEWEYAARAGSTTRYWWGNEVKMGQADCHGCGSPQENAGPLKVGSFASNRFGLFDMGGGVAEWVADCWHANYAGAPTDGDAWECQNRNDHVLRGGSWMSAPNIVRASDREHYETSVRYPGNGFRVARSE